MAITRGPIGMGGGSASGGSSGNMDPDEELRAAAGASSGATGSEILASGGAVAAATDTITSGTKPATIGTARRLVQSGATDAPSDIVAKMTGGTDPNPGHTSPSEAAASVTQTVNRSSVPSPTDAVENVRSTIDAEGGLAGLLVPALAVAAIGYVVTRG